MNKGKFIWNILWILLFLAWFMFLINFVSSSETKNIEYQIRITYSPYCEAETCTNSTNSTNETCYTKCYGKLKVEGVGDNNLFFEIDTGSSSWRDGNIESRFGYKTADLGNLSDITGIREDLRNCTTSWGTLLRCYDTVRELDLNLTTCQITSGFNDNYTVNDCKIDKTTLENQVSIKSLEITNKNTEVEDMKNDKYLFGVGGVLLGFLLVSQIIPYLKGKQTPKDPSEKGFPSNVGY